MASSESEFDQVEIWVITVTLNDAEALARTLQSSAEQTAPLKHFVVDGASVDHTLEVLALFSDRMNLEWISESDLGLFNAMNKALSVAPDHAYLWFVNAGDLFATKTAVQDMRHHLEANNSPVWAYGAFEARTEGGAFVARPPTEPHSLRAQAYWKSFVCHQGVVAKAGSLRKLGGFDERYRTSADFDLLLRLARSSPPSVLSQVLVFFEVGGFSHAHRWLSIREQSTIRRRVLDLPLHLKILDIAYDLRRRGVLAFHDLRSALAQRRLGPERWMHY